MKLQKTFNLLEINRMLMGAVCIRKLWREMRLALVSRQMWKKKKIPSKKM